MPRSAITTELADRLRALPPYLFVRIDGVKREMIAKGVDVVDLGIADPDTPTPQPIIDACARAASDPANHRYPSTLGLDEFRCAAAAWMERYGVACDPAVEVLPLLGSKEGIGHIPLAFVNPGDVVLAPDPCYPVYRSATILAGGRVYSMPLVDERGFLPDYDAIPADVRRKARLMFLNYPNNPTAAVADEAFFARTVEFAKANDIIVVHDAAYLVAGLLKIKSNLDSGMFQALQHAGIEALTADLSSWRRDLIALYTERRDILCDGLNALGWRVEKPKASFYVWARLPDGITSDEAATDLLEHGGVVAIPGTGYGDAGEGYIRMSLTLPTERVEEAVRRIAPVYARWQKK